MALSQDLINQFAKLTVKEEKPTETTVNGTYKTIDGVEYVQIDGSEIWTPVTSTVEAETGERVKVTIKNHTATVIGNISSPSARSKSVKDLKDEVDEQGNTIKELDNTIERQGNSIIQINNDIQQVDNTISQHDNAISQHGNTIQQINNTIEQQGNDITQLNNDIEQQGNDITQINNTITQHGNTITQHGNIIEQQGNTISQQGNTISQQGNTIEQQGNTIKQHRTELTTINSDISILNSAFVIEDGVLTGLSEIVVDELETNTLNAKYANIDFANINFAAVRKIFSDSGIIKDLVVQSGKITGELVGVTIKGDLIEGNTVKAEKLVVKGEDGLYYKLNIDGLDNISTTQASKLILTTSKPSDWTDDYKNYYVISNGNYVHVSGNSAPTWAANTYYKLNTDHQNGLDGTVIIAKSITADKVQVSDLVAFDATIGGFHIGDHSLYSGVKSTVNNTTRGVYLDDSGQVNIGDSNNFIKYFLDTTDNTYKLQISAGSIKMGGSNKTLQETIDEIESNVDNIQVGGRNLVLNSDFRKGKQKWPDWGSATIREIVTIDNKSWFHCITTNNNFVGLSQNRKVVTGLKDIEPNTQYTLSFTMYASEEYSGLSCGIHWNNDTTIIGQNWCSVNLATTPKRFTSTFTSPSDNTVNTFNLMIGKGLNNTVLEYWITDIKLEKGNHSTDWSPAPEDVDESINNVESNVESNITNAINNIEIGGRNLLSRIC